MSPQLALVGLSIVPPVAGMAIVYGRYVRNISKQVQVIYKCNKIYKSMLYHLLAIE